MKTPKAAERPPAFQFYVKAWMSSTAHISLEAQGAYVRLMAWSWDNGPLPSDEAARARLVGLTTLRFRRVWAEFSAKWFPTDVGLVNLRLEQQRAELNDYRLKQSAAGKASAAKRQREVNQQATSVQPPLEPETQPNGKSSSSTSTSKDQKHSGRKSSAPTRELLTAFDQLHENRFGHRAVIQGGKDAKLLAGLCQSHGAEVVHALIQDFFASKDRFILDAGFTVGVFVSQAGKLLARRVRSAPVGQATIDGRIEQLCSRAGINDYNLHTWFTGARLADEPDRVVLTVDAGSQDFIRKHYVAKLADVAGKPVVIQGAAL